MIWIAKWGFCGGDSKIFCWSEILCLDGKGGRSSLDHCTCVTVGFHLVKACARYCPYFGRFFFAVYELSLMRFRNTPEVLNTRTFRGAKTKLSLVWGFLPRRAFFCLTQNFPNPVISRSSPLARVPFIIPKRDSSICPDSCLSRPICVWRRVISLSFVSDKFPPKKVCGQPLPPPASQ